MRNLSSLTFKCTLSDKVKESWQVYASKLNDKAPKSLRFVPLEPLKIPSIARTFPDTELTLHTLQPLEPLQLTLLIISMIVENVDKRELALLL